MIYLHFLNIPTKLGARRSNLFSFISPYKTAKTLENIEREIKPLVKQKI